MKRLCSKFLLDETGATAIEYGIIAGGVALVIIGAVNQLGLTVKTMMFDLAATALAP